MLKRILVPVDLSPCSRAALAYAVFLAEHFGSEIVTLHVIDSGARGEQAQPDSETPLDPKLARQRLDAMLAQFDHEVARRARAVVVVGEPVTEILRAARDGFDLVVVGKYGWGGRTSVGSVTSHVSRAAPCGVVPVWEPDQARGPGNKLAFGTTEPPLTSRSRWLASNKAGV